MTEVVIKIQHKTPHNSLNAREELPIPHMHRTVLFHVTLPTIHSTRSSQTWRSVKLLPNTLVCKGLGLISYDSILQTESLLTGTNTQFRFGTVGSADHGMNGLTNAGFSTTPSAKIRKQTNHGDSN